MPRRKVMKSTWFNRLIKAPLILIFWILCYPLFVLIVSILGGFAIAMKDFTVGVYWTIREESVSYVKVISGGIKFITGRIKNQ